MFDLTFFATGYWQHVFTRTGEVNEGCVYKIPAAFGYVMPFNRAGTVFSPRNAFERTLRLLLVVVPNSLCRRLHARTDARQQRGQTRGIWAPIALLAETVRTWSGRALLVYCRSMRRRKFRAMLRAMEYVSRCGRGEVFFPYQIVRRAKAVLRVDGAAIAYRGPMLIQRMADCAFENGESVRSFDWNDVVVGQQRLWRVGVGLSAWREILGPWGLLDGHARLFDTSGLTLELRSAQRGADEGKLERMRRGALEQWPEGDSRREADSYFSFIREQVTPGRIGDLWGADLKRKQEEELWASTGRSDAGWLKFW